MVTPAKFWMDDNVLCGGKRHDGKQEVEVTAYLAWSHCHRAGNEHSWPPHLSGRALSCPHWLTWPHCICLYPHPNVSSPSNTEFGGPLPARWWRWLQTTEWRRCIGWWPRQRNSTCQGPRNSWSVSCDTDYPGARSLCCTESSPLDLGLYMYCRPHCKDCKPLVWKK